MVTIDVRNARNERNEEKEGSKASAWQAFPEWRADDGSCLMV